MNEPYGDNSRYWIGPIEPPSQQDISPIHEAFQQYRYSVLPRLVLWLSVIVLAAVWFQWEPRQHLRGTVSQS